MGRILPNLQQQFVVPERRRGPRPKLTDSDLRAALEADKTPRQIAVEHDCSTALVYRKMSQFRRGEGQEARTTSRSRFKSKPATEHQGRVPGIDHPALEEGRTLYPATVVAVEGLLNVLVSGVNHWKIGGEIRKGKWAGFPVYTLTLEERATCPSTCRHWRTCYGNGMHFAKRVLHGAGLEGRLEHELALLQYRHPGGFAVRLHVLGDFYSVDYVRLWESFLDRFPALYVFGFTARIDGLSDPISSALVRLVMARWDRFAIRFSNALIDECSTVTVEHPKQVPEDAVLCPQQIGKTEACSTCALCWQSRRRVAFLQH